MKTKWRNNKIAYVIGSLLIIVIVIAGLSIAYSIKNRSIEEKYNSTENTSPEDEFNPGGDMSTPFDTEENFEESDSAAVEEDQAREI